MAICEGAGQRRTRCVAFCELLAVRGEASESNDGVLDMKPKKREPCPTCGLLKRAPRPPFGLIFAKALFIGFAYALLLIWRPRLTARQQLFVDLAAVEASKRGWGLISVWSATALASIFSRIRATDPAYCAWFDGLTAEYERIKRRDNI